jgi:hypothetical protein
MSVEEASSAAFRGLSVANQMMRGPSRECPVRILEDWTLAVEVEPLLSLAALAEAGSAV